MVEEVQEIKQLNLENKLLNVPHNSQIDQKESEIEQEDEFKDIKPISIEFVQHKDEEQKDELSIAFKLQENEEEEKEDKEEEDEEKEEEEKEEVTEKESQEDECDKAKLIKKLQKEADDEIFPKRIKGGLYAFYNIKPKEDKKNKRRSGSSFGKL